MAAMLVWTVAAGIALVAGARRARRGEWAIDPRWLRQGLLILGAGLAGYVAVRLANDGVAPSTADAIRTAGRTTRDLSGHRIAELRDRHLAVLGDLIAWPAPFPGAMVLGLPHLAMLAGLAVALRLPPATPAVTRIELVAGQFWWDAPPNGTEHLEVSLPGGVLRASSARLGVEVGPQGGIVVVIDGSVAVEGPAGTVTVPEGHGLALTPEGPSAAPEALARDDLAADPWIAPHLDDAPRRPRPLLRIEGRGWPLPAVLGALAVALMAAGTYVAQVAVVPSSSMAPTLSTGDRVVVAKAAGAPRGADVVVFERPASLTNGPVLLVKRVVAIGGQRVRVTGGAVVVDGRRLAEPYLPGGLATGEPCGAKGEVRVPAGSLFVLGDNRGDSYDSRCFGPVTSDQLVGTVVLRALPPGGAP
jgi:signal peptidase I